MQELMTAGAVNRSQTAKRRSTRMALNAPVRLAGEDREKCAFTMPARATNLNGRGAKRSWISSFGTRCRAGERGSGTLHLRSGVSRRGNRKGFLGHHLSRTSLAPCSTAPKLNVVMLAVGR